MRQGFTFSIRAVLLIMLAVIVLFIAVTLADSQLTTLEVFANNQAGDMDGGLLGLG